MLGKLAGCQENTRRSVSQQVMVVDFFALQLGHGNRIGLRWRGLTVAQQFAGIRTLNAAKIFSKPTRLQLHLIATFVAFQQGTVVALDLERSGLDLDSVAIGIVSAYVQLSSFVNQIAQHGALAFAALAHFSQQLGFALVILLNVHGLFAGN